MIWIIRYGPKFQESNPARLEAQPRYEPYDQVQ